MNKHFYRITFLLLTGLLVLTTAGCTQNKSGTDTLGNSTSEESTLKESPENKTQNNTVSENSSKESSVKSDRNPAIWSNEEHDAAEKAANEFVRSIKNKDMEAISKQIEYPITIFDVDGVDVTFTNQKALASTAFDKIFDEKFVSAINNSKELSSSWRGFMLGEGSNVVWFNPNRDKTITINSIVTNSSPSTEEQSYAHK